MPLTSLFDREIGLESWFDEDLASTIDPPSGPIPVGDWSNQTIQLGAYGGIAFNGVCHGVVTLFSNGFRVSYDQGVNWISRTNLPYSNANGLCSIGSRFLATQNYGATTFAYTDNEGVSWNSVSVSPGGNYIDAVSDGASTVVAVADNLASYLLSTDGGLTFNSYALPFTGANSVAWGAGQFFVIAVGSTNQAAVINIATPTVATAVTLPTTQSWARAVRGPTEWVVVAGNSGGSTVPSSAIAVGSNLASLTLYSTALASQKWSDIDYANGEYMAINLFDGAPSYRTTNPTGTWFSEPMATTANWFRLKAGNNAFVAVGNTIGYTDSTVSQSYGLALTVTASGAPASMSLSTPTGGAQPVRVASGSMPFIALSAPTGIAQPTVIASGALPVIALSAPNATATAVVTASGLLAAVSLSVPAGAASSVQTATGALAALTLSAPTALAQPDAVASGTLAAISLGAPTAAASVSGSVTATGTLAGMLLSAPTALAQPVAVASGALASIGLTAPSGSAQQTVIASGSLAAVSLGVPTATASAAVTASGAVPFVSLGFPVGVASVNPGDVTASSDIRAISLSAPTAIATVISDVTASGELRILQLFRPEGFASFVQAPLLGRPHRGGWDDEMPVREVYKPAPKTPSDRFADSLRAPYRKPTKLAPAVAPFTRIESVRRVATAVSQLETTPFTPFAPFAAIIAQPAAPALVDEIPDEVYIIASLF